MQREILITTIGIDGAGKPMLPKNVREEFQTHGYDAIYAYGHPILLLLYPYLEKGRRTIISNRDIEEDYTKHQQNECFIQLFAIAS